MRARVRDDLHLVQQRELLTAPSVCLLVSWFVCLLLLLLHSFFVVGCVFLCVCVCVGGGGCFLCLFLLQGVGGRWWG